MSTQARTLKQAESVSPKIARQRERAMLGSQADRGSGWFYWIAGLSLAQSILIQSGGSWSFVFGLWLTAGVDYLAQDAAGLGQALAWFLNALVMATFVVFGYFARQEHRWAYVAGITAYAADGALTVAARDWLGVAVHVLGLFFLWGGLAAVNKRRQMDQARAAA